MGMLATRTDVHCSHRLLEVRALRETMVKNGIADRGLGPVRFLTAAKKRRKRPGLVIRVHRHERLTIAFATDIDTTRWPFKAVFTGRNNSLSSAHEIISPEDSGTPSGWP